MMRDDMTLVREFAATQSEPAFAALVARHLPLVHSAARRQVGDDHLAGEIAQAVFLILARKAATLGPKTILAAWLYRTTRYTAADALKTRRRRAAREQEAYMQSSLNQTDTDAWTQLAPVLDEALNELGETDRAALVLRYFENQSAGEMAAALRMKEDAVQKRVTRALEKLRARLVKRGVTLTATVIAGAVAANSVQAAPVGLAIKVSVIAAKGAAVATSITTLVKGTLKIMAWAKAQTAIVVGVVVLAAGMSTTVVTEKIIMKANSVLEQKLDDGSLLVLNRVSFGDKSEFGYGGKNKSWSSPGRESLVAEFSLVSKDAPNHPLVKPAFYRQFRCVIRGEQGIEYAEEFIQGSFHKDSGGYFGYVHTGVVPRDSRWLWFRIEKSATNNPYGPWQTIAEFKIANPARPHNLGWLASPTPVTNTIDGMNFVLGQITVETKPFTPRDIWNHVVMVPTEVWDHGVLLTNWAPTYVQAADASGNQSYFQKHRSLDPRYVWKLDMDFEPESNFSAENMVTIELPETSSPITTNISDVPVVISWDGNYVEANIPTNHSNLALKFVRVGNDQDDNFTEGSGSWGKYLFRKGNFMIRKGNNLEMNAKPTKVTFAIVPNVHTTFYTQPKLIVETVK